MGVKGLTSFIARNAEQYLRPYELHDCNLVIDGDNLACNLYKDISGTYSAFGGDYDDFYRAVLEFFHVLAECNVHSYVLMDGGSELKKLHTITKRLRGKIAFIKRINPMGSFPIFPVLLKEVFVDAVRECGVPIMRCMFEADDELAALSRKLHCPVLSYDSDFYIHNVRYIPLITVTMKAHTKIVKLKEVTQETSPAATRQLRKNEVKLLEKRTNSHRVFSKIKVDNVDKRAAKSTKNLKTYKYIDCCIYRVKNFVKRYSLSLEKLPIFAALLGNDYISSSAFKNFFIAGMGKIGRSHRTSQKQHRIKMILHFLKHETRESALQKIFTHLKKPHRAALMAQVNAATSGYSNEKCSSFDYFMENYENVFQEFMEFSSDEGDEESSSLESSVSESEAEQQGTEEEEEEENEEEEEEEEEEEVEGETQVEIESKLARTNNDEEPIDETECDSDALSDNDPNLDVAENSCDENDNEEDEYARLKKLPAWFPKKLYTANMPRYFVDLLNIHKYINSPQVEHFSYNDCNEIAIPILTYIFTLLNSVAGEEPKIRYDSDGTPKPIEFTYITRATRVTKICYHHFQKGAPPKYTFQPDKPNPMLFRHVFEHNMHKDLNVDMLFTEIKKLPNDLQLYFLSIVYWLQKSIHCDLRHMHALLICLVVLRTIDRKIPAERNMREFQKRFGKIIKKEQTTRTNEALQGIQRTTKVELKNLDYAARIEFVPKSDCLLVLNNLLKHFHMPEIFKKKYDLFATTIVHVYAEFQAVLFQLHALNSLLDEPFERPQIGYLYCGVFLYNIYNLLQGRGDIRYYVKNFIFHDSQLMFEFYCHLVDWCDWFVPSWKRKDIQTQQEAFSKKQAKRQRQAARKKALQIEKVNGDKNDVIVHSDKIEEEDDFYDLNNKFCALFKGN